MLGLSAIALVLSLELFGRNSLRITRWPHSSHDPVTACRHQPGPRTPPPWTLLVPSPYGRPGMAMSDFVAPSPDEWSAMIGRLRRVLGADRELLGAWVGEPAQLVADWERGQSLPGPAAQRLLRGLTTFADVLETVFVAKRIKAIVHDRLVPMLGGRSYAGALADGADVDIVVDVARSAAGLLPASEAGREYLDGPSRATAMALMYPVLAARHRLLKTPGAGSPIGVAEVEAALGAGDVAQAKADLTPLAERGLSFGSATPTADAVSAYARLLGARREGPPQT